MGANIGTSITNTLVSLMQSTDRNQFRRAFAAATVHDVFNWLTVLILLPVEVCTHYLEYITTFMVTKNVHQDKTANPQFLNKLTKPFTNMVIQVDKALLERIASGNSSGTENLQLIKRCCDEQSMCKLDCKFFILIYVLGYERLFLQAPIRFLVGLA